MGSACAARDDMMHECNDDLVGGDAGAVKQAHVDARVTARHLRNRVVKMSVW